MLLPAWSLREHSQASHFLHTHASFPLFFVRFYERKDRERHTDEVDDRKIKADIAENTEYHRGGRTLTVLRLLGRYRESAVARGLLFGILGILVKACFHIEKHLLL